MSGSSRGKSVVALGISWEEQMALSDDIRRRVEKSAYRDVIMEVVPQLQSDGVTITPDIIAAIEATARVTEGVVE
jgi:hypothetical protein